MLFVTNRPGNRSHGSKRLQAVEPTDSFAITLEYGEKAMDNERRFFRMEELPGSLEHTDRGRTYTRELEAVSVRHELHLRIWFPERRQIGSRTSNPGGDPRDGGTHVAQCNHLLNQDALRSARSRVRILRWPEKTRG